ncbi:hypothetical protein Gotur_013319 [Gossypium turneri]
MERGFLDKVEDNAAVRICCFTFEKVDLVPTVEEYMALLQCAKIQVDRVYSRAVSAPTFLKRLINITGMSEQWVAARIKQKRG